MNSLVKSLMSIFLKMDRVCIYIIQQESHCLGYPPCLYYASIPVVEGHTEHLKGIRRALVGIMGNNYCLSWSK